MEQFPFNSDGFNRSVLNLYVDIFKAVAQLFKRKRKRAHKSNYYCYTNQLKEPYRVFEVVEEVEEVLT